MNEPSIPPVPAASSSSSVRAANDVRFVLAVGGLLVLIIGMLAFLWLRERQSRVRLENDLAQPGKIGGQEMLAMRALQGALGHEGQGRQVVSPFSWAEDRDGTGEGKAVVDGAPRMAIRISREAGERLGFRPGDVVCVSTEAKKEPAGPASAPAGARP